MLAYVHSVLKSALEHAAREEEIPRNVHMGTPTPPLQPPDGLRSSPVPRRLPRGTGSPSCSNSPCTGLRKGELLGLRWEDLDLDAGAPQTSPAHSSAPAA